MRPLNVQTTGNSELTYNQNTLKKYNSLNNQKKTLSLPVPLRNAAIFIFLLAGAYFVNLNYKDSVFKNEIEQNKNWEDLKENERKINGTSPGSLSGVAQALPALMRAQKLQKRASRQGFDWDEINQVFDKLEEEIDELQAALRSKNADDIKEEIGDLLFTCVNLARHAGIDAEEALRDGNDKFVARFSKVEDAAESKGVKIQELSLKELEDIWALVKATDDNN